MSQELPKAWWPLIAPHLESELRKRSENDHPNQSGSRLGRSLPFRVRLVRTPDQLYKAIGVRQQAYAKHLPTLSELLGDAEGADWHSDSIVILAECKEDGAALGTMRVQCNFHNPLPLESEVDLPERFVGRPMAYVARLGVLSNRNSSLVKLALFKALHRYCLAVQIEWILAMGKPPLDRQYERLDFQDVFSDKRLLAVKSSGYIPVRLLGWEVCTAERRGFDLQHPLYDFMFRTYHPDLEMFNSVKGMWVQPRASRVNNEPELVSPTQWR